MSKQQYEIPNISVDVVPVFLNRTTSKLNVVLGRRQYDPFNNQYALPGVLLTPNERLDEAAQRALTSKTFLIRDDVVSLVDLGTFDNPDRDPRGATVSIAKIAVLSTTFPPTNSDVTHIVPLDEAANPSKFPIPFDHNNIVKATAELISEKLLHSKDFTRALLGSEFTTSNIRGIFEQLEAVIPDSDRQIDFSNLGRILKNSGWVQQKETSATYSSSGRGRPSRHWVWL